MSEWQPIGTAPLDKEVLFSSKNHVFVSSLTVRKHMGPILLRSDLGDFPLGSDENDPTHWMPLPEPVGSDKASAYETGKERHRNESHRE